MLMVVKNFARKVLLVYNFLISKKKNHYNIKDSHGDEKVSY